MPIAKGYKLTGAVRAVLPEARSQKLEAAVPLSTQKSFSKITWNYPESVYVCTLELGLNGIDRLVYLLSKHAGA